MILQEALAFDDVMLSPQYSEIESRSMVDVSVKLPKGFVLKHPIIPSNMSSITEYNMAEAIYKTGGLAILHRFMPLEKQFEILEDLQNRYSYTMNHVGVSVGVKEEDRGVVDEFVSRGVKIICIDVAHGDHKLCVEMCQYISKNYSEVLLIAGNVATGSGAWRLWEAGADIVKTNVGSGSICSTRIETGNGIPQLTTLMGVAQAKKGFMSLEHDFGKQIAFISDGGCKMTGDVVKALCFADLVMTGNFFAGCAETPGNIKYINGKRYKEYSGSSTHKTKHVEGVKAHVEVKGSANEVLEKMLDGIRSGCSYQGAANLSELKENAEFIKITGAGMRESHPHDVIILK